MIIMQQALIKAQDNNSFILNALNQLMVSQKEFLNSGVVIKLPILKPSPIKMRRSEYKAYLMHHAMLSGKVAMYLEITEKEKDFFQVDDKISVYL